MSKLDIKQKQTLLITITAFATGFLVGMLAIIIIFASTKA